MVSTSEAHGLLWVKPGLLWGPHVRFRRVQTLVREGSPLVKLRNSAWMRGHVVSSVAVMRCERVTLAQIVEGWRSLRNRSSGSFRGCGNVPGPRDRY